LDLLYLDPDLPLFTSMAEDEPKEVDVSLPLLLPTLDDVAVESSILEDVPRYSSLRAFELSMLSLVEKPDEDDFGSLSEENKCAHFK
jgi:hypothetical protein